MHGWSLYLHIPFCKVRCAYCDFNTYAGLDGLMHPYAAALEREVRAVGGAAGDTAAPVHTAFFGGGTPSLLPLECYARLFAALRDSFELTPDCEITLEANPRTVTPRYLEGLRALGVNRLSFGVQSTHAAELRLLDRLHSYEDVVAAVAMARQAGFDRAAPGSHGLNLDLIFGVPHQTLAMWQASVLRVLALEPEHLSLYALSLEHGTPMRAWVYGGLLPMPDPDLAAEMYDWVDETLSAHGYQQYEISNWGLRKDEGGRMTDEKASSSLDDFILHPSSVIPHYACRHNLQYWRNRPYLGFGAGAHGCAEGFRYSNVLAPAAYIERLSDGEARPFPFSAATVQTIPVNRETAMGETMMLGLRLVREGVREAEFRARFGLSLGERYRRPLRHLKALGLVEWDETGARLTRAGRLLGNRVFREFV
jgi:oxygen-independent coproporphyrinogen-3 oxidase